MWPCDRAVLQPGGAVAHRFHDGGEAFELHPPLPHLDERLLLGGRSEQGRLGEGLVEVAHDGGNFADGGPVLEHQGGHDTARVDRDIGVGELLPGAEIDRHLGDRNALLGEEDTDTARIGRAVRLVEFQVGVHDEYP